MKKADLKKVAIELEEILETMKAAAYGDGEDGGEDARENVGETGGEDGVAEEELTFRLLENIISGLQGFL